MTEPTKALISDGNQRSEAVDISRSFIVQAPAGSGKTELLIQRILALLASVQSPEEVLAITFTRKAAAEMKIRLLEALEQAAGEEVPTEPHKKETWFRARAVLQQDRAEGWNLRRNPARLQIMTIDSLCSSLTRRMPWLARLGDQPGISEDPQKLYLLAAERLLSRLESDDQAGRSIEFMLRHLDNRMSVLRQMLVDMLARRDQWLRYLVAGPQGHSRTILESSLAMFVDDAIQSACLILDRAVCLELTELAPFAANNLEQAGAVNPLGSFLDFSGPLSGDPALRRHWLELTTLLLTERGELRKQVTAKNGFPADKTGVAPVMKKKMHALLEFLADQPASIAALRSLRDLPAPAYGEHQWQTLQCLITLLPLAVAELDEIFRSSGQVDFIKVATSADAALGSVDAPEELLLQLDMAIRHILVDEYQDTSYAQYALLRKLTAGWEVGDGRTLFVVGDPMQSIYRFREADVGLFLQAAEGMIGDIRLKPLQLATNFRSRSGLVAWFNRVFPGLFPDREDILTGAVAYRESVALLDDKIFPVVTQRCFLDRHDKEEAVAVLELIDAARTADPGGSIAILVRSRTHLIEIIRELRGRGLRFQAQDLDLLSTRPVAHDLHALTRALLHPADTVAWLSVLRAPWSGLSLDDLLVLAEGQGRNGLFERIFQDADQIELFAEMSADGSERLARVRAIMNRALSQRGRIGLRRLIESTWISLGGPAVVDAAGLADAEQVFNLLDELDCGGDLMKLSDFERGLGRLYAASDPAAGPELQVMTIHKAKGLEFDTVILPGLGRIPRSQEKSLLRWIEHPRYHLLLAPVPPAGSADDDIYSAIGQVQQERARHEALRLFYVAATRAKKTLHLLGHVQETSSGHKPQAGSLLDSIWDGIAEDVAITEVDDGTVEPTATAFIRRLSSSWRLPWFAAPAKASFRSVVAASEIHDAERGSAGGKISLRLEEGRLIGTVVHHWLELIATRGLESFPARSLAQHKSVISMELSAAGIPVDRLPACVDKVIHCLQNSLDSSRGRWILSPHAEEACELALSGVVDGELMHASIDRTFVDADVRWIIDYKTTAPAPGENEEGFLLREETAYRSQLETYGKMFLQRDPGREIKTALYFPLIDVWRVLPD